MDEMRIAFITTEFVTEENFDGGLSNYLYRLAIALTAMGHHPVVIVSSDRDEKLSKDGFDIFRVNVRLPWIEDFKNDKILRKIYGIAHYLYQSWKLNSCLRKIHYENPIDIVQYTHLEGVGLFKPFPIPSVIRFSSYTPSFLNASKIKGRVILKLVEKQAMKRADGLFCPSYFIANVVQHEIGKPVKVIESPFFLETKDWDESIYLEKLSGKRYLFYFGTLGILKGVHNIAEILKPLLTKYPDLFFLFVGKDIGFTNDCSMRDYIINNAVNFCDRVLIFDKLPHSSLYPLIKHAFAVVLPSHIDNLSNACIESMGMGRIVIGTRGTSFEQLIDDEINGFLCQVNDPADLKRVLDKVINLSDSEKNDIEVNALKRVETLIPDVTVQHLIDYYQGILRSKKPD